MKPEHASIVNGDGGRASSLEPRSLRGFLSAPLIRRDDHQLVSERLRLEISHASLSRESHIS